MTAPSYTTDLATIDLAESTTGWTEPTGATGGGTPTLQTDFYVQGSGCVSKTGNFSSGNGGVGFLAGADVTIASGEAVYIWVFHVGAKAINTLANGGLRVIAGSAQNAYKAFYVLGSDTYPFGGWKPIAFDPTLTADATQGSPDGTWQYFGMVANHIASVAGQAMGTDAIRHGRDIIAEFGEASDYSIFSGLAATDAASSWGILTPVDGGSSLQGRLVLGTATNAVDFRDSGASVVIANALKVSSGFNEIEIRNASSRVDWDSCSFAALGTVSRGNFVVTDNADVNITGCSFTGLGTFALLSATDILNSIFRSCDTVTAPGSTLNGSSFLTPRVAADAGAVIWNSTADPDGNLDDTTFSKGTNAHHAIQLGASSILPNSGTVTLRGITFSGFNASDAQNDSAILLADTGSNVAWTINAVGCSGTVSVKKTRAGDSFTVVADPVTLTVTVVDLITGDPIENVNVLVEAASGGPLGVGTDIIKALTDVDGEVSDTRTYATDQPITGRARLATSPGPYYKTAPIAGTIDSVAGLSLTIQMILDI